MSEHEPVKISLVGHYRLERVNWLKEFNRACDRFLEKREIRKSYDKGWTPFVYGKGKESYDESKAVKLRGVALRKSKKK